MPGLGRGQAPQGSKVHVAVDTLSYLLALHVTSANDEDRAQVIALKVVKLPDVKRGFVLLPRHSMVERSFG